MPLDDQDRKKGLEILKKMDLLKNDETPVSKDCLLYTSPSPRDRNVSRMPSSA